MVPYDPSSHSHCLQFSSFSCKVQSFSVLHLYNLYLPSALHCVALDELPFTRKSKACFNCGTYYFRLSWKSFSKNHLIVLHLKNIPPFEDFKLVSRTIFVCFSYVYSFLEMVLILVDWLAHVSINYSHNYIKMIYLGSHCHHRSRVHGPGRQDCLRIDFKGQYQCPVVLWGWGHLAEPWELTPTPWRTAVWRRPLYRTTGWAVHLWAVWLSLPPLWSWKVGPPPQWVQKVEHQAKEELLEP